VYDIQTMLFQGIYQKVHYPARTTSTREKSDHLHIFIVGLKLRLSFIESLKAAYSGTGFRDDITAGDSYLFMAFFFGHYHTIHFA